MKTATDATLAILAAGQFAKAEMWQFDLVGPLVTTIRLTNWDTDLKVGGNVYTSGVMLKRGSLSQKNDLSVASVDLEISPQFDAPTLLKIGTLTLAQALRQGYFDGAIVTFSKLFMATAGDVSAGLTPWFLGSVADVRAARATCTITIESLLSLLNVSMPRNVYQTGCLHTLYDSGCGLSKTSFQGTGTVSGSPTITSFTYSGLAQASGYFNLGTLKFTSGANTGHVRTVKSYSGGTIQLASPLPVAPTSGDAFTIYAGCDKTQATCTTKFSNVIHFRGYPFIPVPETPYDGGTYNPQVFTDGQQGRNVLGSSTNAGRFTGSYVR